MIDLILILMMMKQMVSLVTFFLWSGRQRDISHVHIETTPHDEREYAKTVCNKSSDIGGASRAALARS